MANTVIYKYPVAIDDSQEISLPVNADIMCVQVQHGKPQLWARVNPNVGMEKRKFIMRGTGYELPINTGRYVGSFQLQNGALVFHLFEASN